MPRARQKPFNRNADNDMWIRPGSALKGTNNGGDRMGLSSNSRYLELADIALGLKKPEGKKKKPAARIRTSEKI